MRQALLLLEPQELIDFRRATALSLHSTLSFRSSSSLKMFKRFVKPSKAPSECLQPLTCRGQWPCSHAAGFGPSSSSAAAARGCSDQALQDLLPAVDPREVRVHPGCWRWQGPPDHRCRRRRYVKSSALGTARSSYPGSLWHPSDRQSTVKFDSDTLPPIFNALETDNEGQRLVLEVAVCPDRAKTFR